MTLVNGQQRLESLIDRLFGYAMSLARDRSEAEDILQDCVVRALAAKRVPRDEAAYRAWCFRILRNLFIDNRRSAGRAVECLDDVAEPELAAPAYSQEALISSLTVKIGLTRLAPPYREIITLIDVIGFSYREAADILAVPTGTVMSRLSRARLALLAELSASNVRRLPRRTKVLR